MLNIFVVDKDNVVDAAVGQGATTYQVALDRLFPLINRLELQRKIQDPKFYDRLKRDILNGCVMPPITIAFIEEDKKIIAEMNAEKMRLYVNENIQNGFILDGIQRLNTIARAAEEAGDKFPFGRHMYFSVLLCNSMDNLLYRMITLNNGQRPMTTRHQIEILTSNLFDFDSELQIETEKSNNRRRGTFKQADFVLGYLAFLSNSTAIDNQKLIEEKLDELLAFKILETDITRSQIGFADVLNKIEVLCDSDFFVKWFKNVNNLVGFCAGIRKGFEFVDAARVDDLIEVIEEFEKAFSSFSISKIRIGQARRNAVCTMISTYGKYKDLNHLEMLELLASQI